jgi:hypothetical protein
MRIPERVKGMVTKDQIVLVATSDRAGVPHLAAAKGLSLLDDEQVAFEEWFCFQTLKNIAENPRIALSLLETGGEHGFQLVGLVEGAEPTEMLDGYSPAEGEAPSRIPQAKHRVRIRVQKILALSTGPHSDE